MEAQEEVEPRQQNSSVVVTENADMGHTTVSEGRFSEELRLYAGASFREMFENSPLGVAVVSSDHRLVAVNPSICRMLNLTEHELGRLTVEEIIYPDDVEKELDLSKRLFSGEIPFFTAELRFMKRDGHSLWVNLTASPVLDSQDQASYCLLVSEDIAERKRWEESNEGPVRISARMEQAEMAVLESSERLRAIVETAHDPIVGADRFGNIIMWNSAAALIFGYSAEEVMNRPVSVLMPDSIAPIHEKAMQRAVAVGRLYTGKHVREVFGRRKDGTEFPVEVSISAGRTQEGMFFTAIIRDNTERRRKDEELRRAYEELELRVAERTAELVKLNEDLRQEIGERKRIEEMLRESERLYHTLVEEVPDVIFTLDDKGRFTYLNLPAEAVLNRPLKEILDTPFRAYIASEEKEKIESMLGLTPDSIWDEEIRLLDVGGEKKFARIRCKTLGGERDNRGYEGVMRDITRRRRLEEQLKESREQLLEKIQIIDDLYAHIVESGKAKAIAEHTAEVAHELRQPLTIIGGFARRIARQLDSCNIRSDAGQAEAVRVIGAEIQRLEKILGTLIDFTRRESVTLEMANPNHIIRNVLSLYNEVLEEKDIKLHMNLRSEVGDIFVDPDRFEQVVRNLTSNAIDASPIGQAIYIETRVSTPGSKAVETAALQSERYFQMKVRNLGPVIKEKDLHTIFSPFFTTKNYGTGIGLTVAKKIVEAHNGSISVHSDEGGTTFTVWIPLIQRAAVQQLA